MSIVWTDGFELYDQTSAKFADRYGDAGAGSFQANKTGRFAGSKATQMPIGVGTSACLTVPVASGDNFTVGISINPQGAASLSGITANGDGFIQFLNGSTVIAKLGIKPTGALVCGRADFTTNIIGAASAGGILTVGNFNNLEVVFTRHASAGVFAVYVDGVLLLNNTGANTGASSIDNIRIQNPSSGDGTTIDDFWIANDATHRGDLRIQTLQPSADTATKQWTASTGTNHAALVDEFPTNGDTDYISDATVANKDLFDLADLADTPSNIYAVTPLMVSRKDDATTREVRTYMKNGTTTTVGTTRAMPSAYKLWADTIALTNPDTAAAWTAANINAMQLGVETVT